MLPQPRSAEWRAYSDRRWPTQWVGFVAGTLAFAVSWLFFHKPNFSMMTFCATFGRYVTVRLVDRRMAALRDDPQGGQFAVSLKLEREVCYGFDEGLLSFEEGWLVYHGHRCVFSLPASAVDGRAFIDKNTLSFSFGPDDDPRRAYLMAVSSEKFKEAGLRWKSAECEPGTVILPPSTPSESAFKTLYSYAIFSAVSGVGLIGMSYWFGFRLYSEFIFLGALSLVALVAYTIESSRILRALRDERSVPRPFWKTPIRLPKSRWRKPAALP